MELFNSNEVYGVMFGDKHSYDDWGVYLVNNTAELPVPRRVKVDVPFRNGSLDVTSAISNKIFYENRNLSFEFLVGDNDRPWPVLISEMSRDVHGQSLRIITDMDPEWYWDAYNCLVETPTRNEDLYTVTITCECYPYKKQITPTVYTITVGSTGRIINCPNDRLEVIPTINTNTSVQITYVSDSGEQKTETLTAGDNTLNDLVFKTGDNRLSFTRVSSDATVRITYRQGAL